MTKEELIGRKFISMPNTASACKYTFIVNEITGELGLGIEGNFKYFNDYNIEYCNNNLNNGTWKLLEDKPKMYKTAKGIEYGIGTQFTTETTEHDVFTVNKITEEDVYYSWGKDSTHVPKAWFEDYIHDTWHIITTIKDYKQVDPKTIKFDFTNTKIKVNNEDESKWVLEAALANAVMPIYDNLAKVHNKNKGWYFNKNSTEYTSANFEEYRLNLKEITIQDILNNMKEVIEVGDIVRSKMFDDEDLIVKSIERDTLWFTKGTCLQKDAAKLKSKGKKKEIIGYETVVDLPGIPKGTKSNSYNKPFYGFTHTTTNYLIPNVTFHEDVIKDTKFFKPIYKQDTIEVKFSKYTATLSKENGLVFSDGEKLEYKELTELVPTILRATLNLKSGTFKTTIKFNVTEVQVGCKTFTPDDVTLVSKAIKELE